MSSLKKYIASIRAIRSAGNPICLILTKNDFKPHSDLSIFDLRITVEDVLRSDKVVVLDQTTNTIVRVLKDRKSDDHKRIYTTISRPSGLMYDLS